MRELIGWTSGFVVVASLLGLGYGAGLWLFGRWLVKALAEVPVS